MSHLSGPRFGRWRSPLVTAVICGIGAALALLAATRTWAIQVHRRPAPQPPIDVARTGAVLLPWLTALALVGLAGAGALLATRGRARVLVGALLTLTGIGMVAGGIYALAAISDVRPAWPALCLACGLLVGVAGAQAVRRGTSWPGMAPRYERPAPVIEERIERGGPSRSDVAMWDALDRGEDPTRPTR